MARARWVGPGFLVAALLSPVIMSCLEPAPFADAGYVASPLADAGVGFSGAQRALLSFGLTLGVIAGALAFYHVTAVRRVLHCALLVCPLELFYRLAYRGPVSPGLLLSVGETSQRETLELLAGHRYLTVCLSLFAAAGLYALVRSWRARVRFSPGTCLGVGAFALAMMLAAATLSAFQSGNIRTTTRLLSAELRATFPFDIASAAGSVVVRR